MISYRRYEAITSIGKVSFSVPIRELGDKDLGNEESAQLLIR